MQTSPLRRAKRNCTRRFLQLLPILFLTALMVNGCAVKQPAPQLPHRRPSPSQPAPQHPSPPKAVLPAVPSVPPVQPKVPSTETYSPKVGPAGSLYASAQEAIGRGNYQQAEITLERALRIEPRNAHYWYTMAQVKYKQKQYAQAIQLCSKSKSFAGKNSQLINLNDSLTQKAQQQLSQ